MFPFHSDIERDYHAWVGLYITTWGGAEVMLDSLIHLLYAHFNAASVDAERPLALARKLRFLRKAAQKLDVLKPERKEIASLTDFLSTESDFRHDLVHGINVNFGNYDPHYAVMARPRDRNSLMGEQVQTVVTLDKLKERYDRVGFAGLCAAAISSRLFKTLEDAIESLERGQLKT